jgi:hypothetical protein
MPGAPDLEYVEARRTLLEALEGLGGQRECVILVGAQAIYLHTGEDDGLAVAPFTTDADLSLDTDLLRPDPRLEQAMTAAGFSRSPNPSQVGTWIGPNGVPIDLMVAESQGGGRGHRGARIPPHAAGTARQTRGLEAALVDRERQTLGALDESDGRAFEIWVAGPDALLVAKLLKIADRVESPSRLDNKDALDAFRLLRNIGLPILVARLRRLRTDDASRAVTEDAPGRLRELFGTPDAPGVQMTVDATAGLEDPEITAASCVALAADVLDALA